MVKSCGCEKTGVKKGAWSPEEDEILKSYVQRYGNKNWRLLPKQAGLLRCGKSCRFRWRNYLRPDIKRGHYSREEEEMIVKLHQELGNRWSAIAKRLPGRTDNEIKNVWHSQLKKRSSTNSECTKISKHVATEEKRLEPNSSMADDHKMGNFNTGKQSAGSAMDLSSMTFAEDCKATNFEWANEKNSEETLILTNFFENFWSEAFLTDTWVSPAVDPTSPLISYGTPECLFHFYCNDDYTIQF